MKNILINDRKWPTLTAKRIPTYGRVYLLPTCDIILYRTAVAYNANNTTA